MQDNKNKFYVTTPIYYVTAKPHLGSLYSTLLADIAARWHKLKQKKTFFLTGTDEHGQKVAEAALKAGKNPKEFVDSFIENYKTVWHDYQIEYDKFIRTTDQDHIKAVQYWLKKLQDNGDIYKGNYTGFYCTPCETFVTEKNSSNSNSGNICESCKRETVFVSEESYFFRLSQYQDRLLEFYSNNPGFIIPEERANEVIQFVKSGLKDLSISRTTVNWGIPFPGDLAHVTYVWADALNNYITAIGYGSENRQEEFNFWWPADMQIIGKDIIKFHAVYWPAFLMACNLPLPKKLLVHGWIKVNNQKMSKSLGNSIDPQILLKDYGSDLIRYYLTRYMAITQDSEFSTEDIEQRNNSDLANNLGNLLNRTISLALKKNITEIEAPTLLTGAEIELKNNFLSMLEVFKQEMDSGYFYRALNQLWKFISEVNSYVHKEEPWKISNIKKFTEIISAVCNSLYGISILLWPVMPTKMELLLESLGIKFDINKDNLDNLESDFWKKPFRLTKIDNLFPKFLLNTNTQVSTNKEKINSIENMENKTIETIKNIENISIEEFSKAYLLVGTIEQAELVKGSEKLLKLQVNFGEYGIRQILSGIKKDYLPQDLITKQALFIYNLNPRKIMGLESYGMMLFGKDKNNILKYMTPISPVPNGTRLH